jgi:hypothetical protein
VISHATANPKMQKNGRIDPFTYTLTLSPKART